MKTPMIKRATRRLAASIAIITVLATSSALAADWTDANNVTYTALKSIKAEGGSSGAFLNTTIRPTGAETVKFRLKPTATATQFIFCSRTASTIATGVHFNGLIASGKLRVDRKNTAATCDTTALSVNTEHKVVADFGAGTVSIDDNDQGVSLGTDSYTPTTDIRLYTDNNGSNRGSFHLYYFQMYSSAGVLQYNLMPAKRDTDSVVGLYDTVNRKFYPNSGVTAFTSEGRTVTVTGTPVKWTGLGDGVSMSDGANWAGNAVPAAGASIDLSGISADTTIIADADRTFGAVTMGTSVITFTNAMAAASFTDTSKIAVAADSTVTIDGDLVFSGATATKYITDTVAESGWFRVNGRIVATGFSGSGRLVPSRSTAFSGTIAASGLFNDCSKDGSGYPIFIIVRNYDSYNPTWVIGSDGLAGTGGFYINPHNNSSATIVAESDFVDSANILNRGLLFIDAAGHEVTLGTNTLSGTGGVYGAGATTIAGGRVIANYDVDNLTSNASYKNPPFTVKSGATLVLNLGANIGTGLLTVEDGGALEVAESGTVTLNGDLSLTNGAALAFNFTERSIAPQLAIASGKSVVFAEGESTNITVKVSGIRPTGGEKVLTTCAGFDADGVTVSPAAGAPDRVNDISVNGDGNIVLDIKPMGMIVIVQ